MSELGELTATVLKAQQWATRRADLHERQWKAVVEGEPAKHRKLLRRLADELLVIAFVRGKTGIRRSDLTLWSRVMQLSKKVGASGSGWDLAEQQKIISRAFKCERLEVHFAALDIMNWYGRLYVKRRLYKNAYDCAVALKTMWSEVLALLAKMEAEHDDPTAARDLLRIWTCLEQQKELIKDYSDAYRGLHRIAMEEYEEQFNARVLEIGSYGTNVDTGVDALSKMMESRN